MWEEMKFPYKTLRIETTLFLVMLDDVGLSLFKTIVKTITISYIFESVLDISRVPSFHSSFIDYNVVIPFMRVLTSLILFYDKFYFR